MSASRTLRFLIMNLLVILSCSLAGCVAAKIGWTSSQYKGQWWEVSPNDRAAKSGYAYLKLQMAENDALQTFIKNRGALPDYLYVADLFTIRLLYLKDVQAKNGAVYTWNTRQSVDALQGVAGLESLSTRDWAALPKVQASLQAQRLAVLSPQSGNNQRNTEPKSPGTSSSLERTALPRVVTLQAHAVSTDNIDQLEANAEQGDASSQVLLGQCYASGTAVEKDLGEAAKWYRKAAEQGNAEGQAVLGAFYTQGIGMEKNAVEGVKWLRKAAEQGNAKGQASLGLCYADGNGVPKDPTEAARWCRKAAEQGTAYGQTALGRCYEEGVGVPKDPAEAFKWYRMAAEQGSAKGQRRIGSCYYRGIGVRKDISEAIKWFRKAADQGDAEGKAQLAVAVASLNVAQDPVSNNLALPSKEGTPVEVLKAAQTWLGAAKAHTASIIAAASSQIRSGESPQQALAAMQAQLVADRQCVSATNSLDNVWAQQAQKIAAQVTDVEQMAAKADTDPSLKQQYMDAANVAAKNAEKFQLCREELKILRQRIDLALGKANQWEKFYQSTSEITGGETTRRKLVEMMDEEVAAWRK